MRKFLCQLLALMVLTIILIQPSQAVAQENTISVSGLVTNMSKNGDSLDGLSVTLHENSEDIFGETEYQLSEDGKFLFENLVFDPNTQYGVSVIYKGALYGLNLDLSQGSPSPIEIQIFETIRSDELLKASLSSILINAIDVETKSISVLEIIKIVNDSDLTYVPGPAPMQILRFGLPEGAYNLMVDSSLIAPDIFQVDRGFGLSATLPPGEYDIFFSYDVPYKSNVYELRKTLRYGADTLRVVSGIEVINFADTSHGSFEVTMIGERLYNVLEASNLARNDDLSLTLIDLPTPSIKQRFSYAFRSIRWELAIPAGLGIIMVPAACLILWLNRKKKILTSSSITQESELLLRLLDELEQKHAEGDFDQEQYIHRKEILKKMLDG